MNGVCHGLSLLSPLSEVNLKQRLPDPFRYIHSLDQFCSEPFLIPLQTAWAPNCPIAHKEVHMRIHGNQLNLNGINPYSAAAEKAAAAQKAANVRKKLMRSASEDKSVQSPEEALMVSSWNSSAPKPVKSEVEFHTDDMGKDSSFG